MAYNIRTINTLDLKPSTGIGVSLPFEDQAVFASVYTTKEQIKYNIINYLLTDAGERVYNPTFGLGIRTKLFEQITEPYMESLKDYVKSGIEGYFASVRVQQVDVLPQPDDYVVTIQITYRLIANNDQDIITVNIQNG